MKLFKIYKYTNLITGECYVGQTYKTLEERAESDMKGYRSSKEFWEAIQHYGTDCWRREILWDGLTSDEASIYEQVEIRDNETLYPYGYNLIEGGNGYNASEETRRRKSESAKKGAAKKYAEGYTMSPETCRKISKGMKKFWSRKTPKYFAREFYLSLTDTLSLPEKRKLMYEKFGKDVQLPTINEWIREWHTEITGTAPKWKRKLEYNPARALFFSLPATISLTEKRKVIYGKFLDSVSRPTLDNWTREWESEIHPSRKHFQINLNKVSAQQFFFSLPTEMSIKEKRKCVQAEFPSIPRTTINSWIREWHTEITGSPPPLVPWNKGKTGMKGNPAWNKGKRKPIFKSACDLFYSLPADMPLSEKRKCLQHEFEGQICRETINRWIREWQPEDSISRQRKKRSKKNKEKSYELFMTLPCSLTSKEKRKLLREKMPDVDRKTIYRWVRKWQSELDPIQTDNYVQAEFQFS